MRPFLKDTLNKLKDICELGVWTAGRTEYANKVLAVIDPDGSLFSIRLFRDQCYVSPKGLHIKDLRIINRDLSRCFLVDNSTHCFGFQMENGIPVLPFMGESTDAELLTLAEYITHLLSTQDPRAFNRKHFRCQIFENSSSLESLTRRVLKSSQK